MDKMLVGPALSVESFFNLLDESIPSLKAAAELYRGGDTVAAKHAFAEYIRELVQPDKFFSMPKQVRHPEPTEELIGRADAAVGRLVISCDIPYQFEGEIDWYSNPTEDGYYEWPTHLNRHADIEIISEAYRATGNEKYAEAVVEILNGWMKQVVAPRDLSLSGYRTIGWSTLQCGIRQPRWAKIIHSCIHTAAFTDDFIVDLFRSIYEHGIHLSHRGTHGNWLLFELAGLANISMIYPVFRESAEWREYVIRRSEEQLERQVPPDGFQYELAPGYHGGVIGSFATVAAVANTYGYPLSEKFEKILQNMLMMYVRARMSDGSSPNLNDSVKVVTKSVLL